MLRCLYVSWKEGIIITLSLATTWGGCNIPNPSKKAWLKCQMPSQQNASRWICFWQDVFFFFLAPLGWCYQCRHYSLVVSLIASYKWFFKSYPMFHCSLNSPKNDGPIPRIFPQKMVGRLAKPSFGAIKKKRLRRIGSEPWVTCCTASWVSGGLVPGEDAMWANLKGW